MRYKRRNSIKSKVCKKGYDFELWFYYNKLMTNKFVVNRFNHFFLMVQYICSYS